MPLEFLFALPIEAFYFCKDAYYCIFARSSSRIYVVSNNFCRSLVNSVSFSSISSCKRDSFMSIYLSLTDCSLMNSLSRIVISLIFLFLSICFLRILSGWNAMLYSGSSGKDYSATKFVSMSSNCVSRPNASSHGMYIPGPIVFFWFSNW